MQGPSWEANFQSATQEILHILKSHDQLLYSQQPTLLSVIKRQCLSVHLLTGQSVTTGSYMPFPIQDYQFYKQRQTSHITLLLYFFCYHS